MKKAVIFVLIFLSWQISAAGDNIHLDYRLDYSVWGGYYPDQAKKDMNFNDLLDLNAGICGQYGVMDSLWLILNFYTDEYEKVVRLEKTGFNLELANTRFGYQYERRAGIGNFSRIYGNNLNSKYYRQPFIISYNFSGLYAERNSGSNNWNVKLGGNEFNSACFELGWLRQTSSDRHNLSILIMGRDNYYQKGMLSLNYEGFLQRNWCWLYAAWSSQLLIKYSDVSAQKFHNIGFMEIILPLCKCLEIGANVQGRYLNDQEKERQATAYLCLKNSQHSISLMINQEEWELNNLLRSLNSVWWWKIKPEFKAGIIAEVYFPQYGNDFYEAGFQVSYR